MRAHLLLNTLDVSRTDIRLDAQGNPRVMEINTLPGLTANYSDLCLQSKAEGIRYEDLILEILYLGASRWGMVEPARQARKTTRKNRNIFAEQKSGELLLRFLNLWIPLASGSDHLDIKSL